MGRGVLWKLKLILMMKIYIIFQEKGLITIISFKILNSSNFWKGFKNLYQKKALIKNIKYLILLTTFWSTFLSPYSSPPLPNNIVSWRTDGQTYKPLILQKIHWSFNVTLAHTSKFGRTIGPSQTLAGPPGKWTDKDLHTCSNIKPRLPFRRLARFSGTFSGMLKCPLPIFSNNLYMLSPSNGNVPVVMLNL